MVLAVLAAIATSGAAHAAPAVNGVYDVSDKPGKLVEGADHNVWVVVGGNTLARFTAAATSRSSRWPGSPARRASRAGPTETSG